MDGRPNAHGGTVSGAGAFDGYPYLVTRIGRTGLCHLAAVPGDWPPARLLELARRQAAANGLPIDLAVGPTDVWQVAPDGTLTHLSHVPPGLPIVDRLALAEPLPASPELTERQVRLRSYAKAHRGGGYIVGDGLEGGRLAEADDVARLEGITPDGLPPGLKRCLTCGGLAGEYLALRGEGNGDPRPRVIDVYCACGNINRCARCGGPLAPQRLSAYFYDEANRKVWYRAAYSGLSHRCPRSSSRAGDPR